MGGHNVHASWRDPAKLVSQGSCWGRCTNTSDRAETGQPVQECPVGVAVGVSPGCLRCLRWPRGPRRTGHLQQVLAPGGVRLGARSWRRWTGLRIWETWATPRLGGIDGDNDRASRSGPARRENHERGERHCVRRSSGACGADAGTLFGDPTPSGSFSIIGNVSAGCH
jgi:hypothetical protein